MDLESTAKEFLPIDTISTQQDGVYVAQTKVQDKFEGDYSPKMTKGAGILIGIPLSILAIKYFYQKIKSNFSK